MSDHDRPGREVLLGHRHDLGPPGSRRGPPTNPTTGCPRCNRARRRPCRRSRCALRTAAGSRVAHRCRRSSRGSRGCAEVLLPQRLTATSSSPGATRCGCRAGSGRRRRAAATVPVVGPRPIGAVDEVRQPNTGVLGELRVEPHHFAAHAVVDGQGQQVAIPGQAAQYAAAGQRDAGLSRRWRQQPQEDVRRRPALPRRHAVARSCSHRVNPIAPARHHRKRHQKVPPVQPGPGVAAEATGRQSGTSVRSAGRDPALTRRGAGYRWGTAVGLIGAGSAVWPIR